MIIPYKINTQQGPINGVLLTIYNNQYEEKSECEQIYVYLKLKKNILKTYSSQHLTLQNEYLNIFNENYNENLKYIYF